MNKEIKEEIGYVDREPLKTMPCNSAPFNK